MKNAVIINSEKELFRISVPSKTTVQMFCGPQIRVKGNPKFLQAIHNLLRANKCCAWKEIDGDCTCATLVRFGIQPCIRIEFKEGMYIFYKIEQELITTDKTVEEIKSVL